MFGVCDTPIPVSIHTPTKGVTQIHWLHDTCNWSFNPHTHEGCDPNTSIGVTIKVGFNPHTHEGCDSNRIPRPQAITQVSIHTPTKGVTQKVKPMGVSITSFNPHTHEGCDFCPGLRYFQALGFNPHTHEGCDTFTNVKVIGSIRFNPHTHEGCDCIFSK